MQASLRHYVPLGQVLLNRGRLTRSLLTTLLRRHNKSARLGDLLVRAGQITTDQLQSALDQQTQRRQPLGYTLMALGYVSEETMRGALCAQLHINFFDLDIVRIDPTLARLITEKYATRRRVVPLFRAGSLLAIAVDDPTDLQVVENLQQLLGMRIEVVTSTTAKIERAIKRLYATGPAGTPTRACSRTSSSGSFAIRKSPTSPPRRSASASCRRTGSPANLRSRRALPLTRRGFSWTRHPICAIIGRLVLPPLSGRDRGGPQLGVTRRRSMTTRPHRDRGSGRSEAQDKTPSSWRAPSCGC